jgi:hypothetical protein
MWLGVRERGGELGGLGESGVVDQDRHLRPVVHRKLGEHALIPAWSTFFSWVDLNETSAPLLAG